MTDTPTEAADVDKDEEEDAGAGVFGSSSSSRLSSAYSCSRPSSAIEESSGGRAASGASMHLLDMDESSLEGREGRAERKVKYKGKWYTETEIAVLEEKARQVRSEVDRVVGGGVSPRSAAAAPGGAAACPGGARRDNRLVVGPSLVDLGKGPKQLTRREETLNADPEALKAAIVVVEGMRLEKVTTRKIVGRVLKTVYLKMTTGGVLTWGKGKDGHVMWVRAHNDLYDPSMSKKEFELLQRRFSVMLEGEQVMAHSSEGGTIRACEAAEALEFVAATREQRDLWVKGINMVLGMAKKEALERETKKRMKEVHAAASNVASVFITSPRAAQQSRCHQSAETAGGAGSAQAGDGPGWDEAGRAAGNAFGSKEQRESIRRADDRARKGWGGKISVPTGAVPSGADDCEREREPPAAAASQAADSSPSSALSSTSTHPASADGGASNESDRATGPAACTATCWPPVSPGSASKRRSKPLCASESVELSPNNAGASPPGGGASPNGRLAAAAVGAQDGTPTVADVLAPPLLQGLDQQQQQQQQQQDQQAYEHSQEAAGSEVPVVKLPQPDSEGSEILSELTTAQDTPRVEAAAALAPSSTPCHEDETSELPRAPSPSGNRFAPEDSAQDTDGCWAGELRPAGGQAEVGAEAAACGNRSAPPRPARPARMSAAALPKLAASASAVPGAARAPPEPPAAHVSLQSEKEPPAAHVSLPSEEEPPKSANSARPAPLSPLTFGLGPTNPTEAPGGNGAAAPASTTAGHLKTGTTALGAEAAAVCSRPEGGDQGVRSSSGPAAAGVSAGLETVGPADAASRAPVQPDKTARKLHSRQDDLGKPTPGKIAAPKKQDFAALMAARQQKMRDAEESGEGMYFD